MTIKLIHNHNGTEINTGDVVADFRGIKRLVTVLHPTLGVAGKIGLDGQLRFPQVVNAKFIMD